ncbi:MAG: FHA domain-containing protein [Actinobacteria bacterium]|nr:FHA domain-containing protein [Actinomycetota bacterium]
MPEIVLDLLKFLFLGILYIFIARAVRVIALELKGTDAAPTPARAPAPQKRTKKKAPTKAVIVQGDKKGKTLNLDQELIIGRGDKAGLVLDDTYVSTVHARIFAKGDTYMLEDLGSTNGTYLNRQRVTSQIELQRGDQVKIGKTVLEMRR